MDIQLPCIMLIYTVLCTGCYGNVASIYCMSSPSVFNCSNVSWVCDIPGLRCLQCLWCFIISDVSVQCFCRGGLEGALLVSKNHFGLLEAYGNTL